MKNIKPEHIVEFYRTAVFGNEDDVRAAAKRAYRDMCRTLKFRPGADETIKREIYNKVINEIIIPATDECTYITSKDDYDKWHDNTCIKIIEAYSVDNHTFHYGQSQKWINMLMKYLCIVLNNEKYDAIYEYLHIPIDSIIIEWAKKEFNISPCTVWSKLSRTDYIEYHSVLWDALRKEGRTPIEWEFTAWLKGKE